MDSLEEKNRHCACVSVHWAVDPEHGEDSFAFCVKEARGFLCVADGCGGIGAKRYESMGEHTGAFLAARLATECVKKWNANNAVPVPERRAEGQSVCKALSQALFEELQHFEATHANERSVRIVGRMQRTLPTTLCAAIFEGSPQGELDCLFLWAGDSRGYLLNQGGLHQLTADHTAAAGDALESLYQDAPLRNMLSADANFTLSARRVRVCPPCVVMVATDGAFAYLPTPMEFEWMLLSTLKAAENEDGWQRKLTQQLKRIAADDCTVLLAPVGFESFSAMKDVLEARRMELQREFITPVRRHKSGLDLARQKWEKYRQDYDWTKGKADGDLDWRI